MLARGRSSPARRRRVLVEHAQHGVLDDEERAREVDLDHLIATTRRRACAPVRRRRCPPRAPRRQPPEALDGRSHDGRHGVLVGDVHLAREPTVAGPEVVTGLRQVGPDDGRSLVQEAAGRGLPDA